MDQSVRPVGIGQVVSQAYATHTINVRKYRNTNIVYAIQSI